MLVGTLTGDVVGAIVGEGVGDVESQPTGIETSAQHRTYAAALEDAAQTSPLLVPAPLGAQ